MSPLILNFIRRLGWVVNAKIRPLYVREQAPVPILQSFVRAPGPVCANVKSIKVSCSTGVRSPKLPACSNRLYRLRHAGPKVMSCVTY